MTGLTQMKPRLPTPSVAVLDPEPDVAESVAKLLRSELTLPPGLRVPGADTRPTVESYTDPKDLRKLTQAKARRASELCVLVSDNNGFKPRGRSLCDLFATRFPRTNVVLHSDGIKDVDALRLYSLGMLYKRVDKVDRTQLVDGAQAALNDYWSESAIGMLRTYIDNSCRNPKEPFYETEVGKPLNLIDAYWQIVFKQEYGDELLGYWQQLLTLRAMAPNAET